MLHTKEKTTRFSFYFYLATTHLYWVADSIYNPFILLLLWTLNKRLLLYWSANLFFAPKSKTIGNVSPKNLTFLSFLKTILILSCFYFPFSNKQKSEWHPVELHVFSNSVIHKLCEKSFTDRENLCLKIIRQCNITECSFFQWIFYLRQ